MPYNGLRRSPNQTSYRSIIFGQVANILAQKDLKGTAIWVEQLPLGKATNKCNNLLSKWTDTIQ